MKKIILILCLILMVSCVTETDDSQNSCTEDCTTFKGKISKIDGGGISNVPITLKYEVGSELGGYTRIIAKTKTNKDGTYEIDAFIRDKELGNSASGYFEIDMDDNKLNAAIPSNYIKPSEVFSSPDVVIYSIEQRNLVFENNYVVPLKANLKINLVGFSPIQKDDFFWVAVGFEYGYPNAFSSSLNLLDDSGFAKNNFTTINTFTVLNDSTKITVGRKKNGVFEQIGEGVIFNQTQSNELIYHY